MTASGEYSPQAQLPSIQASYLIDLVFEVGICQPNGFGLSPISWSDLDAWSRIKGIHLSSYEGSMIVMISRIFVTSHVKYDDKDEPAPHVIDSENLDRTAVSSKVGNALRSMAKKVNRS